MPRNDGARGGSRTHILALLPLRGQVVAFAKFRGLSGETLRRFDPDPRLAPDLGNMRICVAKRSAIFIVPTKCLNCPLVFGAHWPIIAPCLTSPNCSARLMRAIQKPPVNCCRWFM